MMSDYINGIADYEYTDLATGAGVLITSGPVTVTVAKDGGDFSAVAFVGDDGAGTAEHCGGGRWRVQLSAAENTCDKRTVDFAHASLPGGRQRERGSARVFSGYSLENRSITNATFDESTAYPVRLPDTGSSTILRRGVSDTASGTTIETAVETTIPAQITSAHSTTDSAITSAVSTIRGADSDTLKSLSDQMDGVSGALSGEGAYTGTLTVDDGDGTVLEGAVVHARRGGVLKASGTTDASGEITGWVFGAYTYDLAVKLSGYQPKTDTITVSGDAWTKTISLTAISITAPDDASLCTVQFRVKLSSTAVEGAVCKAKLLSTNQAADGTVLSNAESSDTTDSEGVAELQLVRRGEITKGNGMYRIWIEIDGNTIASVDTSIPNQSTILFEDLLD
jgi:hypothetical protein